MIESSVVTPPLDPVHGPSPLTEYQNRLTNRRSRLASRDLWERRIADARLVVFVAGLVLAWYLVSQGMTTFSLFWILIPPIAFAGLLIVHERLKRAVHRAGRAVAFYEKGLARLEERWAGQGVSGDRFLDPNHPYAADLDLFGTGSLFERLCTARTRVGMETLASWLLQPATPDEISNRQGAVTELRGRLDLREELELLGADVGEGIDAPALVAWGNEPRVFRAGSESIAISLMAITLAALAIISLVCWGFLGTGPSPFFAVAIAEIVFAFRLSKRQKRVLAAVEERTHDLVLLAAYLERLETEMFQSHALTQLQNHLKTDGEPASRRIARLARLLIWLEAQQNQFFAPVAGVLLWSTHLSLAIDRWRSRSGPNIDAWLRAIGEFEAISALATYRYESPEDVFPEILPSTTSARLEAEQVGHPLLARATCVRNDVTLGGVVQVLVISGSNMSGKSTLLRTVGVNAVLALAGAPVRARRMALTPLAIGGTLRIQDSLQAGRSRFYAEITRVRQLVDLSRGPVPLLFLLDEIFHGTNSHDRRVGAEAVVRGLIERGAIGLVTTHDLALTSIVDQLGGHTINVHFEDQFVEGTMRFDYRMRPGVVQHSNALALMRAVGLDV